MAIKSAISRYKKNFNQISKRWASSKLVAVEPTQE